MENILQQFIDNLDKQYRIESSSKNFHVENYTDHYVETSQAKGQGLNFAVITTDKDRVIQSVLYKYNCSELSRLYSYFKSQADNLTITENCIKNRKHITISRKDYHIFIWEQEDNLDVQYITQDFFAKISKS